MDYQVSNFLKMIQENKFFVLYSQLLILQLFQKYFLEDNYTK